jgi:hypothetical protein
MDFCIYRNHYERREVWMATWEGWVAKWEGRVAKLEGWMAYTQKNFRNACYQVGFCTGFIPTGVIQVLKMIRCIA